MNWDRFVVLPNKQLLIASCRITIYCVYKSSNYKNLFLAASRKSLNPLLIAMNCKPPYLKTISWAMQ